ncbi:hypothetical protein GCM10010326_71320 [Streptomyces xanthochromogenes]|uniref:Uncharacterized protein n=1 Tax=Streptomyces xanthochromogenes TaxID=67384 RepID=A0ABQ3AU03_9ACTN|nr:hypothetical protein GCM10010326_71320 [Streptomyces xanthochromogenes]
MDGTGHRDQPPAELTLVRKDALEYFAVMYRRGSDADAPTGMIHHVLDFLWGPDRTVHWARPIMRTPPR